MKRFPILLLVALLCGCGSQTSKHIRVIKSATKVIPEAVQMEKLYGSADHFITHFGDTKAKSNVWNTEVFFGGRYQLIMQLNVLVDYDAKTVTPLDAPQFFLWEIGSVNLSSDPNGAIQATYSRDIRFSKKEWSMIYESGGDYKSVGIELLPEPVPGFERFAGACRAPRIATSLVSD